MLSREQFETQLEPLHAALEQRRRRYLRYFYAGLAVSLALIGAGMFAAPQTLQAIQSLFSRHAALSASDTLAFRIFAVLCAVGMTLGPVLGYRGESGLSVERALVLRIFNLFGAFTPLQGEGISIADFRREGLSVANLRFQHAEGVMGELAGVRLRLCDAAFYSDQKPYSLQFSGLAVWWELRETDLPQESRLRTLQAALSDCADRLPLRWDEKLTYRWRGLCGLLREYVTQGSKEELPSEKEYRLRYSPPRRPFPSGEHANALDAAQTVECSGRACLLLVPGMQGMFSMGSLFAPCLTQSLRTRIYSLMSGLAQAAGGQEGASPSLT